MSKTLTRYASRLYGADGIEYTGDMYPTLHSAKVGARAQIKEMRRNGEGGDRIDYHIHEWQNDRYGEIVAGSDI